MELKTKKLQEIHRKSSSRQSIGSSIFGFVQSFSQADRLYSIAKESLPPNSKTLPLARATVLALSVRSLETMLRDLAMSAAIGNDNFRDALVQKYWKSKFGEFSLQNALHMELLLDQVSFQRIESFNELFALLFKNSIFQHLESQTDLLFFLRSKVGNIGLSHTNVREVVPGLESLLITIFQTRHEIIHNANFSLPLDDEETDSFQQIILFFGQVLAAIVGEKTTSAPDIPPERLQVCIRFSTYAQIMEKIAPPERRGTASVQRLIQKHLDKEASSDHVDHPSNMMQVGPFLLQLHDIRLLDIETENCTTSKFEPANQAYGVFPRSDGKLELHMLTRTVAP